MDLPPRLPPKKDVALALLQGGPSVYVHLDPRRDGVLVPKNFKKQAQLVLQLGMSMAIPIPDLEVDDDGITCTLSFSRTPFWCRLPWTAVFALVGEDGRGMVWPDDIPAEIAQQQQRPSLKVVSSSGKKKAGKGDAKRREEEAAAAGEDEPGKDGPSEDEPGKDEPGKDGPGEAPALAAVPDAGDDDAPPASDGGAEPPDPSDEQDEGTKRELPPYLRVIK